MNHNKTQCANCGGFDATSISSVTTDDGRRFDVVKCTFCGLIYVDFGRLFANHDDYSRQVYQPRAVCTFCGSNAETTTTKKITLATSIRRYHHCRTCDLPFTTYENRVHRPTQ